MTWHQAYIAKRARQMGLDPRAVLAVAAQEGSSGWGGRSVTAGIGDSGTSFGPWQLHWGGAYPAFAPHGSAQAAQAWAMSRPGIDYALRQIQGVAKGLTGREAIASIVNRFERPAAPDPEISRAWAGYSGIPTQFAGAPPPPGATPPRPGTPPRPAAPPPRGASTKVIPGAGFGPSTIHQFDPGMLAQGIFADLASGRTPDVGSWVGQSYKDVALPGFQLPGKRKFVPPVPQRKGKVHQNAVAPVPGNPLPPPGTGFVHPGTGKVIGTPGAGTHTLGNWESDRALDVAMAVGTPIRAPFGGVIGSRFGSLGKGGRFAGLRLHIAGAKDEWYGAHLSRFAPGIKPGVRVKPGQIIGYSGSANGVAHLHESLRSGNPFSLVR